MTGKFNLPVILFIMLSKVMRLYSSQNAINIDFVGLYTLAEGINGGLDALR